MINPMKPVRLRASQQGLCRDGSLFPRADIGSAASYCRNLSVSSSGRISPVRGSKLAGLIEGRLIGTDRQPGREILFSQFDDGEVCIEGYIDPEGEFVKQLTVLGNPLVPVVSMGCSGRLVVLSLQDGTLLYIHRTAEGYRWLGALPETPQATAEAVIAPAASQARIDAYKFSEPVTDLRPGVSEKVRLELGNRLLKAYSNAVQLMHDRGQWHNPVAVRFAYRLYDGSLLSISAPVPVGLNRSIDYCPVANLPLVPALDEDNHIVGIAGTDDTTIQINGYNIAISCPEIPEGWRDVITGIDMYISADPEGVDMQSTPTVNARQLVGVGQVIAVHAIRLDRETAYKPFCNGVWYRHSMVMGDMTIHYRKEAEMHVLDMQELTEQTLVAGMKARLLLAHDDMLHLANISRYMPLCLPGGYMPDSEGNATIEPLALGSSTGLGRFNIPPQYIMETNDTVTVHAPLLLWYNSEGVGRYRLRVQYEGAVYEAYIQGKEAPREKAWMYLNDGTDGIQMTPVPEGVLGLPHSVAEEYPSMVMTMQRGNPLIAVSHTRSVGGEVTGMHAQQVGGGAYTRQYIYLFTHIGITALTHSYVGVHTNCRSISAERVSQPDRLVVPTSHGVYALADTGRFLVLNDARCSALLSGLGRGWKGLGWDGENDELWLCHQQQSIVIQCGEDMLAHVRTSAPDRLWQIGTELYSIEDYRLLKPSRGEPVTDCCWIGMPELYQPGVARILSVPLHGSNLSATVLVENVAPDIEPWEDAASLDDLHRAAVIERVEVRGDVHSNLFVPLHPLSVRKTSIPGLLRVSIVHSS